MGENRVSRNRLMCIARIDFPQSCQEKSRGERIFSTSVRTIGYLYKKKNFVLWHEVTMDIVKYLQGKIMKLLEENRIYLHSIHSSMNFYIEQQQVHIIKNIFERGTDKWILILRFHQNFKSSIRQQKYCIIRLASKIYK